MGKPGRPRLDPADESTRLIVAVPVKELERIRGLAQCAGLTIPEWVRRTLSGVRS